VIKAYERAYAEPLVIKVGETLTVGANDTQWPGFVWCTNQAGRGGWVPESYFERRGEVGVVLCDYEATELSARVGEALTLHQEESGWFWCTNQQGQRGWIPADNLEII
jgi:uncharacterized protein YgiM (DUF1202 family)